MLKSPFSSLRAQLKMVKIQGDGGARSGLAYDRGAQDKETRLATETLADLAEKLGLCSGTGLERMSEPTY